MVSKCTYTKRKLSIEWNSNHLKIGLLQGMNAAFTRKWKRMVSLKTSNNPGALKTLNNVWRNLDHYWNYMMNLNNFFQTQRSIQWQHFGICTWTWFKHFGILSNQLKMEIGICTCKHLRKCYIDYILMTTITTQDTFHTTGLHNKRYLNIIQQYMKNLKKVIFLFDVLLANSTKCPLIKLLSRP